MASLMTINNVDTFIELIKQRPLLYMKDSKEYTDINLKKKLWEEVCTEIVPNWTELSAENKMKYGLEVQKKWMNLRSCFTRELKLQKTDKSGRISNRRRKYMYYDQLLFLLPSIKHRTIEHNVDSQIIVDEEFESQDSGSQESNVCSKPSTSQYKNGSINLKKKKSTNFEEALLNILQKEVDEDTNFVLSLVPTLRSLTEDEKFQAKIQILDVFRQIKRNRATKQFSPDSNNISHNFSQEQNIPTPLLHISLPYTSQVVIPENAQNNPSSPPIVSKHHLNGTCSDIPENTEQSCFIDFPDKSPKTETPSP
ncbi:uncharacterized protein LOC128879069 [Hylaeus volcanicus]|uniref:uncharacterized protein LOC128879069 n=1 Tax=Hylaeus volcanicus TaxID=313075 RepID=UPI0023B81BC9|nr:uncharacterized protein LOC128879069 [Hylaeus volcanicus]